MALAESFLPYLQGASGKLPPGAAELEAALAQLLGAARHAWPELALPEDVFLRHVAERLPETEDVLALLAKLHAADLFLTCGCLRGDARALSALDARFLSRISGRLTRGENQAFEFASDVLQELRTRLLVARGATPPSLAGYKGRGPLAAWVRAAAVHAVVDLRRAQNLESIRLDDDIGIRTTTAAPELDFLRQRYRPEFESAFRSTLSALPARDANILRLYYLEEMTAREIGAMYSVSARAVQLWLAAARRGILEETLRLLASRLDLSSSQLDGLMGLVKSQLEVSLYRLLDKRDV